jgi:hypothetical protein
MKRRARPNEPGGLEKLSIFQRAEAVSERPDPVWRDHSGGACRASRMQRIAPGQIDSLHSPTNPNVPQVTAAPAEFTKIFAVPCELTLLT